MEFLANSNAFRKPAKDKEDEILYLHKEIERKTEEPKI